MGKIKLFKSLTFLNVLSVFGIVWLILMMTFQTLLAWPILGWASWASWWWGWTYANDWWTDTTNWKKWWVLVISDYDVPSDVNADLGSNYRFWTFLRWGIIYRANAAWCKEVLLQFPMYAKNYTDGSYDNLKYYSNAASAAWVRAWLWDWGTNWWIQWWWKDGNNNGREVYWNFRNNWSNTYRTSRQNRSRHWYSYYSDDPQWWINNYWIPVVCKK